jgi:cell division protein ZapE
MSETPMAAYQRLIEEGEVRADAEQERVLRHLDRLYHELKDYPEVAGRSGGLSIKSWRLSNLFRWSGGDKRPARGLYI